MLDSFLRRVLERIVLNAPKVAIVNSSAELVRWLLTFHKSSPTNVLKAQVGAVRTASHADKKSHLGKCGVQYVDGMKGLELGQVCPLLHGARLVCHTMAKSSHSSGSQLRNRRKRDAHRRAFKQPALSR